MSYLDHHLVQCLDPALYSSMFSANYCPCTNRWSLTTLTGAFQGRLSRWPRILDWGGKGSDIDGCLAVEVDARCSSRVVAELDAAGARCALRPTVDPAWGAGAAPRVWPAPKWFARARWRSRFDLVEYRLRQPGCVHG